LPSRSTLWKYKQHAIWLSTNKRWPLYEKQYNS
jgi:hypothetical protein